MDSKNILYSRFGFDIALVDEKHGPDIFRMLSPTRLSRKDRTPEKYAEDRRGLKSDINFALTEYNYNSIGIFKDDKLLGISFSSITDENSPWLGYFYIEPEVRKTKAMIVLLNYLMNHLYKGFMIEIGATNTEDYKKMIRQLPIVVGYSVFKEGVAERLSAICDTGSGETK
jgi:hypothetical protein